MSASSFRNHSGDVKRGVLRSILHQAELTADELIDLL
jgi:hypothetical protein